VIYTRGILVGESRGGGNSQILPTGCSFAVLFLLVAIRYLTRNPGLTDCEIISYIACRMKAS